MRWDIEEIELLKIWVDQKYTYKQIGVELDRTTDAIKSKCLKLGIKSTSQNKWTKEEISKLQILIKEGLTHKEVSTRMNYTVDAIKSKCLKLNLLSKNKVRKTTEEYIKQIPKDLKVLEEYQTAKIKIKHKHNCGYIWKVTPDNILHGFGCPKCAEYGFNPYITGYTYLIYLKDIDLYKIGITNYIEKRIKSFGYKAESILIRKFSVGKEAKILETLWLKNIEPYKINTGLLKSGNTETFRI